MTIADANPQAVDQKCTMVLETSGPPDISTWEDVWEAATRVTGMCSTQGKNGVYFHVGEWFEDFGVTCGGLN